MSINPSHICKCLLKINLFFNFEKKFYIFETTVKAVTCVNVTNFTKRHSFSSMIHFHSSFREFNKGIKKIHQKLIYSLNLYFAFLILFSFSKLLT